MINLQITELCHHFIQLHIAEGSFCIDATAGNGNDTAFLCRLCGDSGHVLAFDIQEQAILSTINRLNAEGFSHRADVILDSHCNMTKYAGTESIDCIVFNFGYLPGADHNISTKAGTSISAIETGLTLLKKGGLMSLCIYSGGDTGFEERDAILAYVKDLDSKRYTVLRMDYFNRPNNPPIPVMIIKR